MRGAFLVAFSLLGAAHAAETPEGLLVEANRLDAEGKASRAVEVYRTFLKDYPEHSQVAEAHYRLARCLDSLGWVDEAVEELEKAVAGEDRRFRNRPVALFMLGKLRGSLKEYARAAEVLEQLLAEGAGLDEDEALSLCGGYYALLGRTAEAAAKFNILKRRPSSRFAEQAAYRLAALWLKAEELPLAIEAIEDLAARFPRTALARGLMLQAADLYRKRKDHAGAIAVCGEIRARFPDSEEAAAAGLVLAHSLRDRGSSQKAIEALDALARAPAHRKTGLAAEAAIEIADIIYGELRDPEKAMPRYEEAVALARESSSERRELILRHACFRLAEHHFARKEWSVALEYYVQLRRLGSEPDVLGRILRCQSELGAARDEGMGTQEDIEAIRKRIDENPGTFAAAEGEVFLIDLAFAKETGKREALREIAEKYEAVLKAYPADVLRKESLGSYVQGRIGLCHARGETPADRERAIAAFEKAISVDPKTPYEREILENWARVADATGDASKAFDAYRRLFSSSAARVERGDADEAERRRMSEYLKALLSRAERKDSIDEAIRIAREIAEKSGPFSDAARHALFYIGDLLYLKKDYSGAAKSFKDFVRIHGPKQRPDGHAIDAPWKAPSVDDRVLQVYEAAVRIAHSWQAQGHVPNMLDAYAWIVRNIPERNEHVAEAQYWLAVEIAKGEKGKDPEKRRAMAEALWKNVVNPSFDFDSGEFKRSFHFWVAGPEVRPYVKTAILKSGEVFAALGEHQRAAAIFRTYFDLFRESSGGAPEAADPKDRIARYGLGKEYIALGNTPKLIECWRVYIDRLRDDRFRVSALWLLGHHAARDGAPDIAIEAYATILDEYGSNDVNEKGETIPVPPQKRIRGGRYPWDGIRMPPPAGVNLGEIRFALGYVYWKKEDWGRCVEILLPFSEDPRLYEDPARARALYMVAQSFQNAHDDERALEILSKLIRDHSSFPAIEEAYARAARCAANAGKWAEVQRLYDRFLSSYPRSAHRPHMDLFAAAATVALGKDAEGMARLASIAASDTYEDVKADALYWLGAFRMGGKTPDHAAALQSLRKSVDLYPRERACLAAAKCSIETKDWEQAKAYLERTIRQFPAGDRKTLDEARRLLPEVLKKLAKKGEG